MRGFIDSQIVDLLRLVRRPGVKMIFAGFTVALAFFTISNHFPEVRTDRGLLPLAFWGGEAVMLVGLIRLLAAGLSRFVPPGTLRAYNYRLD